MADSFRGFMAMQSLTVCSAVPRSSWRSSTARRMTFQRKGVDSAPLCFRVAAVPATTASLGPQGSNCAGLVPYDSVRRGESARNNCIPREHRRLRPAELETAAGFARLFKVAAGRLGGSRSPLCSHVELGWRGRFAGQFQPFARSLGCVGRLCRGAHPRVWWRAQW